MPIEVSNAYFDLVAFYLNQYDEQLIIKTHKEI